MTRSLGLLLLAPALGVLPAAPPGVFAAPAPDTPECVIAPPRFNAGPLRTAEVRAPLAEASGVRRAAVPSDGSVHLLVILAEFADIPHRIPASRFVSHLFGSGRTLRTYYQDVSGGRLDVTGDVFGWYTLPQSELYYSSGNGGVGTYPNNGQRMAEDAVAQAVAHGVPLGDYDADADGTVDAVLVIHSGEGYEWAGSTLPALSTMPDPNAINSHKWLVTNGNFGAGLPRVADYFTGPEMQRARPVYFPAWADSIAEIGVFCHEFGHVLGLPDFYDTQTSASRIGAWEIMDSGTWTYVATDPVRSLPGSVPAQFGAWSKAFLGWSAPDALAPPAGEVEAGAYTLASATQGAPTLQLLANPFGVDWTGETPGSGEFFLAEVRTRVGWDEGLPAAGMILYHVDEARTSNRVSDSPDGGGLVVLVPQDGEVSSAHDATDPWPGTSVSFGSGTFPSSALHDGSASGVELTGITAGAGGTVSFTATVSNLRAELPLPFARPQPFRPSVHGTVGLVWSLAASPGPTRVRVFDLRGRPVRTLDAAAEFLSSGRIARWDGRDEAGNAVPSGVYFFRADPGGTGRIVLLRD